MKPLGRGQLIEVITARGALLRVALQGGAISSDTGRRLVIAGRCSPRLWADAWRLGWRPWRREFIRVRAVTYRTMRFFDAMPAAAGGRRARAASVKWGGPAYRHEFEDAWLSMSWGGRLVIAGGFALDRLRLGCWGGIRETTKGGALDGFDCRKASA